jgi:hypothetical protein
MALNGNQAAWEASMSDSQTAARIARVEQWKAEPAPYCIMARSRSARSGYRPVHKGGVIRRFRTVDEALAEIARREKLPSHRGDTEFVDFASAKQVQS